MNLTDAVCESSHGNESARILFSRKDHAVQRHYNTSRIVVLEGVLLRTFPAQPEVLHRMSVRRRLARRVRFVKSKKMAFSVVEPFLAIRICADRKHRTCSCPIENHSIELPVALT